MDSLKIKIHGIRYCERKYDTILLFTENGGITFMQKKISIKRFCTLEY